jgi:hypothetical protein
MRRHASCKLKIDLQYTSELRDGSMPLAHPGLADHLRQTVVTQVAIDQPRYSGYLEAIAPQIAR